MLTFGDYQVLSLNPYLGTPQSSDKANVLHWVFQPSLRSWDCTFWTFRLGPGFTFFAHTQLALSTLDPQPTKSMCLSLFTKIQTPWNIKTVCPSYPQSITLIEIVSKENYLVNHEDRDLKSTITLGSGSARL